MAVRQSAAELARLTRRYGARPGATEVDLFLGACLQADRPAAERQLNRGRVHRGQLTDADRATLYRAAETGNTAAVRLMLDLGFSVEARGGDGGTPLHAAAYSGGAETVQLLLDRGADLESRDSTWGQPAAGLGHGRQRGTAQAQPRRRLESGWQAR